MRSYIQSIKVFCLRRLFLIAGIAMFISCTSSTQSVPVVRTDYSKYSPMYVGDSTVYIYYPHDSTDSLISEKCIGTISKGAYSYYMYRVHTTGKLFPKPVDTVYRRTTSDGDVYYYEGSDVFGINFHAIGGGKVGGVRKKYFSTTTPLGSFDSCISIVFASSFPDSYTEETYAPNLGMIYNTSIDSTSGLNLIYAEINGKVYR